MNLLSHHVNSLDIGGSDWIESLMNIMKRFYTNEGVTAIRLEALNQLQIITSSYLLCYEVMLHLQCMQFSVLFYCTVVELSA